MRYPLSLAALVASLSAAPAADHWPQFRGPAGDGTSASRTVATKWSETENVRWKTPIHGKGWSSPVVWGDQIWLTTAPESGHEFYAVCIDLKSGKHIHDTRVFSEEKSAFCHPYNSYASPTPVVEEGRVYVHFGTHGTACLDTATGKTLWERRDLKCDHWRGPGSSPVLHDNLLFLTFDGYDVQYITALDKSNGKTVWKKDRAITYSTDNGDLKKAYSTPSVLTVNGKPQLVSPAAEATVAYDPATGNELWTAIHGGMNAAARPVSGHGLVFLTSGHPSNLLGVRLGGSGILEKGDVAWKTNRAVPSRPSLLLIDDLLYMVSDNGFVSCVEAKTGTFVWNERLGGKFSASPVAAGGHLYFTDEDEGKTHILAAGRTFKVVAVNKLDAGCMASPAIVGDALLVRTKTHLYCIGAK